MPRAWLIRGPRTELSPCVMPAQPSTQRINVVGREAAQELPPAMVLSLLIFNDGYDLAAPDLGMPNLALPVRHPGQGPARRHRHKKVEA